MFWLTCKLIYNYDQLSYKQIYIIILHMVQKIARGVRSSIKSRNTTNLNKMSIAPTEDLGIRSV